MPWVERTEGAEATSKESDTMIKCSQLKCMTYCSVKTMRGRSVCIGRGNVMIGSRTIAPPVGGIGRGAVALGGQVVIGFHGGAAAITSLS